MTDDDLARFLNAPLGSPGSGRVRYGAAMALYAKGAISAEVLEVYRIASAHDGRDPASLQAARGLPPLPDLQRPATSPLGALYAAARAYALTLDHPGAAEVRAGLPGDPGPETAITPRMNPVVSRWLGPALQAVTGAGPLREAIATAASTLEWVTYDAYPPQDIGPAFARGHAFASILGGEAPFAATDFEMGLFLIAPGVLYRDHHHPAPELYAPLTGPHDWRFGPGRGLVAKPAHQPVWNPAHQPHLTRVGTVPFLALFVWTRDVNAPARVLPAADWAKLEDPAGHG